MKVYLCLISGDEMFTETYPVDETKIEGCYVVKGKFVTRKGDDVDDSLIGGNASAEGGDEGAEDPNSESGVDVILDNRLKETGFGTKKEYQVYMKDYMKSVFAKLKEKGASDDQIAAKKKEVTTAFTTLSPKFKDLQFYSGSSMNPDGHIAMVDWVDEEEDGKTVSTPYVYFYKAGIEAIKY